MQILLYVEGDETLRRVVFGIMLILLLVCLLTCVFNVRPVKASGTIYIRADGSIDPPTDLIRRDGDVYILTGNITSDSSGIVIARNNMTLDGAGYTLQGIRSDRGYDGIILSRDRRNVTIRNMRIRLFTSAIFLDYFCQNNNVVGNNIEENGIGIYLFTSDYNNISENNIDANGEGIRIYDFGNSVISGNNITNNERGIYLYDTTGNNKIYHNNFVGNSQHEYKKFCHSNLWDDGYPSGGNFWDDYLGIDQKSGPNQDQPGSDLIGDTPYTKFRCPGNIDHYPLMSLYGIQPIIPKADFTYSPESQIIGEPVIFDAKSSTCPNGTIIKYSWNFGDGKSGTGMNTSHIFRSYGNYEVTLRVVSNTLMSNTQTKTVNIKEHPIAYFTLQLSNLSLTQPITFDASLSKAQGGTILSYFWDWGDGHIASTSSPTTDHTYHTSPGEFNVTLTVLDSEDLNSSYSKTILVKMPTSISITASLPFTFGGLAVDIHGNLHNVYGNGLQNELIVLSYTFAGATEWIPIASAITDHSGNYYTRWTPPATGHFTIKAEWAGNTTYIYSSNQSETNVLPRTTLLGLEWPIWAIIAIIIGGSGTGIAFILRRKKPHSKSIKS